MTPWLGHTPRRWQPEALDAAREALRTHPRVIVQAATGAGKALWLAEVAATARGSVLLTVPTQALVEQLHEVVAARCGEAGRYYQYAQESAPRVVVTCAASLPRLLADRPRWDLHLADEAHRSLPATPEARWAVALSATPFRGLQGYHGPVYTYSAARAVEDGVLVPHRVIRYDGAQDHLPEDERTDAACRAWLDAAEGPGIVTAADVADAERWAASTSGVAVVSCYQRPAERAARIEALRTGALRALVSVRLLSEGVDLPWLRWLCLRVPVASPITLVQLVGRVLRAAPGKAEAVVYDPHGALDAVGLVHTGALDAVALPQEPAEQWEIPELLGLGEAWATLPAPVAVAAWEGWVADLRARLCAAGLVEAAPEGGREWRGFYATDRQRRALEGLRGRAVGRLPEEVREAFRWLLAREDLRRGPAQDAIDALAGIAQEHRRQLAQRRPWWKVARALVPDVPAAVGVAV